MVEALIRDVATIVGLLALGAAGGGMFTVAWLIDRRSLLDQFRDMNDMPDSIEARARRSQT